MSHPLTKVNDRKYPFANMRVDDYKILDNIDGRHICSRCKRSRKYFCYTCILPVGDLDAIIPKVNIPVNIDIIKHRKETDGKSTAIHAGILAKERIRIYTYPDIPDYSQEKGVVLIFPGHTSLTVAQLFDRKVYLKAEVEDLPKGYNQGTLMSRRLQEIIEKGSENFQFPTYTYSTLPVCRAVFIDSTWNQSRGIYKDERIKSLRTVVLQNRISQFWRHQRGSPRWYCSTIEAIHQFLLEVHINAWGLNPNYRGLDELGVTENFYNTTRFVEANAENINREAPYNGQYDNLLYFFAYTYDLIHKYYDHNELKAYRRPI